MAFSPKRTLCFVLVFTIPALFLLHSLSLSSSPDSTSSSKSFSSGDLLSTDLAWNALIFSDDPPPLCLRIAVFSRKWPVSATPGGMERHALTLHSALARRGHHIHVFTSPVDVKVPASDMPTLEVHFHEGDAGLWRYNKAWEEFLEENKREPFDVVHTESVSLPYFLAKGMPNVVVTWQGIAMESLYSYIYQDLALRKEKEPFTPAFSKMMETIIPSALNEIRFFHNYAQHVATSDSCGELLRDVYQIPSKRVHVILNGVNEDNFHVKDSSVAPQFRANLGIPKNATVVGAAGRLVRDKGHPLMFQAFSNIIKKYPNVYLIVVGSGPWGERYKELGKNVLVLGPKNATELGEFYNSIDVFINPTLRPQGLDQTFMEAMMSGRPVMAPRFPSITGSLVVDKDFGFLFQPNVDAIEEALDAMAKESRERLAERGRASSAYASKMFGARKMSLAYERLFLCIKDANYYFWMQFISVINGLGTSSAGEMFIGACYARCQSEIQETWLWGDSPVLAKMVVGDWYYGRNDFQAIDYAYPCNPTFHNRIYETNRGMEEHSDFIF